MCILPPHHLLCIVDIMLLGNQIPFIICCHAPNKNFRLILKDTVLNLRSSLPTCLTQNQQLWTCNLQPTGSCPGKQFCCYAKATITNLQLASKFRHISIILFAPQVIAHGLNHLSIRAWAYTHRQRQIIYKENIPKICTHCMFICLVHCTISIYSINRCIELKYSPEALCCIRELNQHCCYGMQK